MSDFLEKNKKAVIGICILLILVAVYFFMRPGPAGPDLAVSEDVISSPEQIGIGQSILVALEELRRVKVDTTVFQNPVFKSLIDQRTATTSEEVGRPDPFKTLLVKPKK